MLNPEQKAELARMLETHTLNKAIELALLQMDSDITTTSAEMANIQLAIEKGARFFVRTLKRLAVPSVQPEQLTPKNQLRRPQA